MVFNLFKIRYLFCIGIFAFSNCDFTKVQSVESPSGYDFAKGTKIFLLNRLEEVSGIAFVPGSDTLLMAVNDEEGRIYPININTPKVKSSHFKFAGSGDYEDIAFFEGKWRVLESDGTIHSVDIDNNIIAEPVKLLPKGEYEGMAAHNARLYVACKDCPKTKDSRAPVYLIKNIGDSLYLDSTIIIDASTFIDKKHEKILVSALALHPFNNEWFMLSHLNGELYITDANFKVKQKIKLSRAKFLQPEGIAFSSSGDLFISNEGDGTAGSIIVFKYKTD
jgi:WD40 repeat protein